MPIDIVLFEPNEDEITLAKKLGFTAICSLEKAKKKLKMAEGGDDNANRIAVENKSIDILLNPHSARTRDFMHSRNSGMNHILARLAAENNITIAFSLNRLETADDIGRARQIIKLCRKYKTRIAVFSLAENPYQLRSLNDITAYLKTIGMDSRQANESMKLVESALS